MLALIDFSGVWLILRAIGYRAVASRGFEVGWGRFWSRFCLLWGGVVVPWRGRGGRGGGCSGHVLFRFGALWVRFWWGFRPSIASWSCTQCRGALRFLVFSVLPPRVGTLVGYRLTAQATGCFGRCFLLICSLWPFWESIPCPIGRNVREVFFLCYFPSLAGWIPPQKVLPLAHLFPPPDIFIRRFHGSLWVLRFPCVVKRPISYSVFVLIVLSLWQGNITNCLVSSSKSIIVDHVVCSDCL